jgi:hypothetical protein
MILDALGYRANRHAMRRLAAGLLDWEGAMVDAGFHDVVAAVLGLSGIARNPFIELGRGFMSDSRLGLIQQLALQQFGEGKNHPSRWINDGRPANAPERRLWGAAKLVFDLYSAGLCARMLQELSATGSVSMAITRLIVRIGSETFVGPARAAEVAVNAVVPIGLAVGIARGDRQLVCWNCAW